MRFAAISLFSALFFISCSRPDAPKGARAEEIPVVAVERAAVQDLQQEQTLAAEFRPYQEIDIHAKVAGYVKKIYVDVGDRVTMGQTLAVLEIPEMVDELARVQAAKSRSASEVNRMRDEISRAEAAYNATHSGYERLAGVAKSRPNLVAAQEIDDARAKDQSAAAQVSAARAALASAQQQVDVGQADVQRTQTMAAYATITAPFAGVVTHRYADTGAMVPAGTANSAAAMPVVKLSQNSVLRLILPVPESLSARVHKGDEVTVRVPALSRQFAGKVTRMTDAVNTSTRTMETEIDVQNPSLQLIPGMYAQAVLVVAKRTAVLAVPLAALAGDENSRSVYLVDADSRIRIQPVKVGLETANRAEVMSGVSPGAMIVTGPRGSLTAGEKVTPKMMEGAPR